MLTRTELNGKALGERWVVNVLYSQLWCERVVSELRSLPSRTWLLCSRESGIDYAVERLHTLNVPDVVIWLDEHNSDIPLGDTLSEALTAGLGTTIIGKGTTVAQGLKALSDFQRLVGPLNLVVGWTGMNRAFVDQIVAATAPSSRLIVVDDIAASSLPSAGFVKATGHFLGVSFDEAVSESRGAVSDTAVVEMLADSGNQYKPFKLALLRKLGIEQCEIRPARKLGWSDSLNVEGVLAALAQRRLWADVFDLACDQAPESLEHYIDDIGNYYFNKGAFSYFWSRLRAVPPDVKRREKVTYWIVSLASATSRWSELDQQVKEAMLENEAPDVRAATAVARPTTNMLAETSRAVEIRRTPATLRAHGYAMAWSGNRSEPVGLFREALRLAENDKADHLVIACAVDLAEVELKQGNYKSGAEWSEWAIGEHARRGLTENLRLEAAVATSCFARLLLGDLDQAKRLMDSITIDLSLLDVPGYEAVVSTRGDLALVTGDVDLAVKLYSAIHKAAPLEVYCISGLSLLYGHIARGDVAASMRLAESAFAVSRSSSAYERALADLMVGMVLADSDCGRAEAHLSSAIEGLGFAASDIHVAQASAWLALARLKNGFRKEATQALALGARGMRELGASGWQLLCCNHMLTQAVRKLWTDAEFEHEFSFLGRRSIRSAGSTRDLGLRSAEILATLAIHSSGLSGERLHAYVYGDTLNSKSTLKVSISRLREIVPIKSSPYRIDATYAADFIDVLEFVSTGRLESALNLYKGSLLPESESPLIREWRDHIDECLRAAVIGSGDPDLLIQLGTTLNDDLEVWELAKASIEPSDYRRPLINARIRRIKAYWGV